MSNEAAERLRGGWRVDDDADADEFNRLLDAALTAERRATVERIRAALDKSEQDDPNELRHGDLVRRFEAILDAALDIP